MHRIRICTCILVFLAAATLLNGCYLRSLTDTMTKALEDASASVSTGDWDTALRQTKESKAIWDKHQLYFCITLRRTDTDAVDLNFQQIEPLLQWEEEADYTAANAELIANIRLLNGTESLDLKNLL